MAFFLTLVFLIPGCFCNDDSGDDDSDDDLPEIEAQYSIIVNASHGFGQIAPIHGVNNGPWINTDWDLCQGLWYSADYSEKFNQTMIPSSRTHGEGPGDMNRIWKHLDSEGIPIYDGYDPLNASNYDFSESDERISKTMGTSHTQVYWRLGYSKGGPAVENCPDWRAPPDNFTVFAQAAVQVLKHYREGWADGYYYDNFNVVEVWNEPYLSDWWSGTPDQYFEMYHEINSAVTTEFGETIDVVAALELSEGRIDFSQRFLELAQQSNEPIDAVYVHLYRTNPSQTIFNLYGDLNNSVESLLDQYGYPKNTPVYITEWNRNIPVYAQSVSSQSYLMSVLTIYNELWEGNQGNSTLGHTNLRMAHFFASRSFMWNANLTPKPPGHTWEIYGEMISETPERLFVEGGHNSNSIDSDELNILAGKSVTDDKVNILITRYVAPASEVPNHFSEINETISLTLTDLGWGECQYDWEMWALVDSNSTPWQLQDSGTDSGDFSITNFEMNQRTYHLIQIERNQCQ